MQYYSQWGQDKFLNETIFNNKRSGTFVDIGAHDGVTISNSYFFEKNLDWQGICVEPILERYNELVKNRNCICHHCCVFDKSGKIDFTENSGYTEMLSGITEKYDSRHLSRKNEEQKVYGGDSRIVKKQAYTLTQLLTLNSTYKVDFLSIDTEGSEFEVLKGLDFKKFYINTIVVENNYPDTFSKIDLLLEENGFYKVACIGGDEIYRNKK